MEIKFLGATADWNLLQTRNPFSPIECQRWQKFFEKLLETCAFVGMQTCCSSVLLPFPEISQSEALYWCFVVKCFLSFHSLHSRSFTLDRKRRQKAKCLTFYTNFSTFSVDLSARRVRSSYWITSLIGRKSCFKSLPTDSQFLQRHLISLNW